MPYLTKQTVTVRNVNGDTFVHEAGTVLSDWEVSDFIRSKIAEGSAWYRERFDPLLEREAHQLRVKSTAEQGAREVDGQIVPPPFDDYVGLHPAEIIQRMSSATLEKVRQVRLFERGGMNRNQILNYVSPAEREPWQGYNTQSVGDILEKLSICSPPVIVETKMYEGAHQQRPAILDYDKELYGDEAPQAGPPAPPVEPEPQPPVAPEPVAPAPPAAQEGAIAPTPEQQVADAQPLAPTPPPEPVAAMGPAPQ